MEAPKSRQHPSGSSRSTTASPTPSFSSNPRSSATSTTASPVCPTTSDPRGRNSPRTPSRSARSAVQASRRSPHCSRTSSSPPRSATGRTTSSSPQSRPPSSPRRPVRRGRDNIRLVGQALGKESLAEAKITEYETRAATVGKEINEKANNPVISVVRFAGEPTARLYRTTSFSGIVLQDAGLKRPDNQGPDHPADAGNIMMKISPELINEADADVIFISTWQDAEGKSAEAAKPFPREPAVADPSRTQGRRGRFTLDVAGQHPGRPHDPRRPLGHVRGGQAEQLSRTANLNGARSHRKPSTCLFSHARPVLSRTTARTSIRRVSILGIAATMLVLGGCSSDSSDDPASTIVRTTTSIAGAGVMGIERDTATACPTPDASRPGSGPRGEASSRTHCG